MPEDMKKIQCQECCPEYNIIKENGKIQCPLKILALVFKTHDLLKRVQLRETAFIKEISD